MGTHVKPPQCPQELGDGCPCIYPLNVDLKAKIRVLQIIWENYDYFALSQVARKHGTPGKPNLHPMGRESLFFSTWFPRNFRLKWCKTSFLCVEASYPGDHQAGDAPRLSTCPFLCIIQGNSPAPHQAGDVSRLLKSHLDFLPHFRKEWHLGDAEKARIYQRWHRENELFSRLSPASILLLGSELCVSSLGSCGLETYFNNVSHWQPWFPLGRFSYHADKALLETQLCPAAMS